MPTNQPPGELGVGNRSTKSVLRSWRLQGGVPSTQDPHPVRIIHYRSYCDWISFVWDLVLMGHHLAFVRLAGLVSM